MTIYSSLPLEKLSDVLTLAANGDFDKEGAADLKGMLLNEYAVNYSVERLVGDYISLSKEPYARDNENIRYAKENRQDIENIVCEDVLIGLKNGNDYVTDFEIADADQVSGFIDLEFTVPYEPDIDMLVKCEREGIETER